MPDPLSWTKGFKGLAVTPVKKRADRELYMRENEYNCQIGSIRAPIERAAARLKAWKIIFRRLSAATRHIS